MPGVKSSLHAFAVRILRRVERPFRGCHITQHIGEDLFSRIPVKIIFCRKIGLCIDYGQKRLIVEHFFEVGEKPAPICRITVESITQVIENSSPTHGLECFFYHVKRGIISRPFPIPKQEQHVVGRGKFGCLTESTKMSVKTLDQLLKA